MLTVRDILSLPCMADARLATPDGIGLDRAVRGMGILDYEPLLDRYATFGRDEVVLTTLAFAHEDPGLAEEAMIRQMDAGIAGILIKDILVREVSERVIQEARRTQTTIAFFTKSFMEDAVTEVKLALDTDSENNDREAKIDELLSVRDQDALRARFRDITGLEGVCVVCAAFTAHKPMDVMAEHAVMSTLGACIAAQATSGAFTCRYHGTFVAIMAFDEAPEAMDGRMEDMCRMLCSTAGASLVCGLGDAVTTEHADRTIRQALMAAAHAKSEEMDGGRAGTVFRWSESGFPAFADAAQVSDMYQSIGQRYRARLATYDADNGTDLSLVAKLFVEHSGNANEVADEMHLHPNSVRNRMAKVRKVLDASDASDRVLYAFLLLVFLDDVSIDLTHLLMQ